MNAQAVVLTAPHALELASLPLSAPGIGDVVVESCWSGISSGTERLLYTGRMPAFPGMGYPLVPGYETAGRVVRGAGGVHEGALVFVPGATCFEGVRSLFGATASHLVVPAERVVPVPESLGERAILLALAATAQHALAPPNALPDLIVGHGVLGRLLARLAILHGAPPPTVWERDATRSVATEYPVISPENDTRRDYRAIYDASGDAGLLDTLVRHLAPGGEIVLAGFYAERLSFAFPPAFMKEARLRIAAQWRREDLDTAAALAGDGRLSLDGLVTHRAAAGDAPGAYRTAFGDPACLKMILDWSAAA